MRPALVVSAALLLSRAALADDKQPDAVLLKTIGEGEQAQELDATLRDALQDLGMHVPIGEPQAATATRDIDLVERAASGADGTWVVSPRIEPGDGGAYLVRILAVAPKSKEIRTRVELVKAPDVAARGLVMLRDLVRTNAPAPPPAPCPPATVQPAPVQRSAGRAVLAINGTLFGGFVAYGLHRVTRTDDSFGDARVAIPLATLGAGVGLGASLLVAEEWDITPAMAWYVAAGTWWGVAAGLFFASGFDIGRSPGSSINDRFYVAISGGGIGLSLATFALTRKRVDEGGMLLTHSSAAMGLLVGGLVEVMANGPNDPFARPPSTGWGFGTAFGLVGGGTLALLVRVPPTRVLLVDLGSVLGGLAGAAAGSPLIVDNKEPDKTRGWAIATLAGAVAGTGAAIWFTRSIKPPAIAWRFGTPYVGMIGTPLREGDPPAMGVGVHGTW
jgi:hypothetical protein